MFENKHVIAMCGAECADFKVCSKNRFERVRGVNITCNYVLHWCVLRNLDHYIAQIIAACFRSFVVILKINVFFHKSMLHCAGRVGGNDLDEWKYHLI